jgi:hypothetical protein
MRICHIDKSTAKNIAVTYPYTLVTLSSALNGSFNGIVLAWYAGKVLPVKLKLILQSESLAGLILPFFWTNFL